MEYAEENLAGVLSERALTTDETRETLKPISEALAYLHSQGLVHGNLKLSNILAVGETVKISSEAVSAGDPAADIQSLGIAVAQALTRQAPILGQNDQNIVDKMAFPYRELVRNCLHHDPRLRWSAAKIGAWLQSAEQTATADVASAAPVTKPAAGKPRRRNYAAVTVVVLGTALAGGLVMRRMAAPTRSATNNLVQSVPPSVPPGPLPAGQTALSEVIPQGQTEAGVQSPGGNPVSDVEIRRRVLPDIPAKARNTVHGKARVVVRVEVDPDGNVVHATLAPGGSPYFGRLALEAAKHWQFAPAKSAGSRDWILRFEIMRTATRVTPLRAAPE
jgi:TonB family protein